jgi:hypothetical protein
MSNPLLFAAPCRVDLSKATGLEDLELVWELFLKWVVVTSQTLTPHANLQRILFGAPLILYDDFEQDRPADTMPEIPEVIREEWLEFDHFLVQFCESCSIRPEFSYHIPAWMDGKSAGVFMGGLLPEVTASEMVDMVQGRWD